MSDRLFLENSLWDQGDQMGGWSSRGDETKAGHGGAQGRGHCNSEGQAVRRAVGLWAAGMDSRQTGWLAGRI